MYIAHFDGGATPNPGSMKIGGFVKDSDGNMIATYSKDIGEGTNNIAEYSSLLTLIDELVHHNIDEVTIYGDSLLVVNQVNEVWKVKDEKMKELKTTARQMLSLVPNWELKHVKREHNKEADSLT